MPGFPWAAHRGPHKMRPNVPGKAKNAPDRQALDRSLVFLSALTGKGLDGVEVNIRFSRLEFALLGEISLAYRRAEPRSTRRQTPGSVIGKIRNWGVGRRAGPKTGHDVSWTSD